MGSLSLGCRLCSTHCCQVPIKNGQGLRMHRSILLTDSISAPGFALVVMNSPSSRSSPDYLQEATPTCRVTPTKTCSIIWSVPNSDWGKTNCFTLESPRDISPAVRILPCPAYLRQ